jgi:uncharacterized glyoxalase superfamily protein PhnB
MPAPIAIPYFLDHDAQAALDWIVKAFGCKIVQTQLDEQEQLFHADV